MTDKVRRGELEAGLVALPVDESGLVVEPVMSDEILYAALSGPETSEPMSVERLAETRFIVYEAVSGWKDSIRRRAQIAGRRRGCRARRRDRGRARRVGARAGRDRSRRHVRAASRRGDDGCAARARGRVVFAAIFDTFAFIRRRDHALSPATAELIRVTRARMASFGRPVRARR